MLFEVLFDDLSTVAELDGCKLSITRFFMRITKQPTQLLQPVTRGLHATPMYPYVRRPFLALHVQGPSSFHGGELFRRISEHEGKSTPNEAARA